jgi:hypothetical protein
VTRYHARKRKNKRLARKRRRNSPANILMGRTHPDVVRRLVRKAARLGGIEMHEAFELLRELKQAAMER